MKQNNDNKTAMFLIGAVIGSVIALMFAPFSGRKLRRVAKEKGKDALDTAKDRYNKFESDTLKPNLDGVKYKGKMFWGKTSDKIAQGKETVSDKVEDMTEELDQNADALRRDMKIRLGGIRARIARRKE